MHTSAKKKLIIIGIGSTVAFAGAAVGGWALVNYYKENVKTPTQQLAAAVEQKIVPTVNESLTKYSAEWMSKYSTDRDFDFSTVPGYNPNLKYNVIEKKPLNNQLNITVKVSVNNFQSSNYTTTLKNQFASPETSASTVINQTIDNLPKYIESMNVSSLPDEGMVVAPETITINSPDFKKEADGSFMYEVNGSSIKPTLTLGVYSTEEQITAFVTAYIAASGTTITAPTITAEIKAIIKNQNTVIMFEINETSAQKPGATIIVKDFSDVDYANFIENATEHPVVLNNPAVPPTAQEIIASINNNNPERYLSFQGLPSVSNFSYQIQSATVEEGDVTEGTLNIQVIITQLLNQNTKTYTSTLTNLLSKQQNELNNIIQNEQYSQWAIKPKITSAYSNKTIVEIINSPELEAFEFVNSELQRYPAYKYEISSPTQVLVGSKAAISVYVEMVNKENPEAKYGYYVNITEGFKP